MKLICLGTGSPEPNPRRASSGYLVEIGGASYLFDMGGGVMDRLIASGRMPWEVDQVFFSHLHSDHMIDLPRYLHACWDKSSDAIIDKITGPAPLQRICEAPFKPGGFLHHDLIARTENQGSVEVYRQRGGVGPRPGPKINVTEIEPGWAYDDEAVHISTFAVQHAGPQLLSLGYRLTEKATGNVLVYPGDSALTSELAEGCKDADLLIHWCFREVDDTRFDTITRLSPDAAQIGDFARANGVKRLLLTHFRPSMDAELAREQAQKAFGGEVVIAEDLMEITL